MYIEPSTSVRFLRGVPLDNRYKHTLYFDSQSAQNSYFVGQSKYNVTNYTYQRKERGYLKVGIKADNLYDCNYMMYQNSNFGSKWFYAFITGVEYVSNDTSLIQFEIDEIQTWLFEMQLKECYVERQHTESDNKFEHYEPEPVEFGDLITYVNQVPEAHSRDTESHDQYIADASWSTWAVVISTPPLATESNFAFQYNGTTTCTEYFICENTSASVDDFLQNKLTDLDQTVIYSAYLVPSPFVGTKGAEHSIVYGITRPITLRLDLDEVTNFNGYVPKNNKIFSSPYTVYEASDGSGNTQFYKPELFTNNGVANFNVTGKYIGAPQVMIQPLNYKGEYSNLNECFVCGNYPMVSFASDTYRAWLANNAQSQVLSFGQQVISGAGQAASGNVAGMAQSLLGIGQTINNFVVASNQPNKLMTTDNSDVMGLLQRKVPRVKVKGMTKYWLKQVDDFFTVYGYNISKMGTPNVHARKEFTYVKTADCVVSGNIPQDSMKAIANSFDNGITWWVNPSNVGDYSVDNGVLG